MLSEKEAVCWSNFIHLVQVFKSDETAYSNDLNDIVEHILIYREIWNEILELTIINLVCFQICFDRALGYLNKKKNVNMLNILKLVGNQRLFISINLENKSIG